MYWFSCLSSMRHGHHTAEFRSPAVVGAVGWEVASNGGICACQLSPILHSPNNDVGRRQTTGVKGCSPNVRLVIRVDTLVLTNATFVATCKNIAQNRPFVPALSVTARKDSASPRLPK